jgi:hypothetical protein
MKSNLEAHDSVQGGDVMGTTKIDVSQGNAISVAKASYEPGYDLGSVFEAGYIEKDCLIRGYCDYGTAIGEDSPIGGKKIG